tara:strand:- start:1376 stop:2065 length:690 start_codon:yes stop_codon:yes gene_type:complete
MTKGQFSLLDMIEECLLITGPCDVALSTWTAGLDDVNKAGLLLEKGIIRSVKLLVDHAFANTKPEYAAAVLHVFGADAVRTTRNHSKIALLSNDDWTISIRSSMNLNRNPRFEQFDIDTCPQVHAFFCAFFDEMSESMPEGFGVPFRDMNAVFSRARRGQNPFLAPSADPRMGEDLVPFVRKRLKAGGKIKTFSKLAKAVGCKLPELNRYLGAAGDDPAVRAEVLVALA